MAYYAATETAAVAAPARDYISHEFSEQQPQEEETEKERNISLLENHSLQIIFLSLKCNCSARNTVYS